MMGRQGNAQIPSPGPAGEMACRHPMRRMGKVAAVVSVLVVLVTACGSSSNEAIDTKSKQSPADATAQKTAEDRPFSGTWVSVLGASAYFCPVGKAITSPEEADTDAESSTTVSETALPVSLHWGLVRGFAVTPSGTLTVYLDAIPDCPTGTTKDLSCNAAATVSGDRIRFKDITCDSDAVGTSTLDLSGLQDVEGRLDDRCLVIDDAWFTQEDDVSHCEEKLESQGERKFEAVGDAISEAS